jgi:multiple sugar transport system ATP-binding protein
MIYVTHDQVEAMTLADRIVLLRDGVIEQQGAPLDLFEQPATLFVAGFLGSPRMNFLKGRLEGPDGAAVRLGDAGPALALPRRRRPTGGNGAEIILGPPARACRTGRRRTACGRICAHRRRGRARPTHGIAELCDL